MSDVSSAAAAPETKEAIAASFGAPDEGEARTPVEVTQEPAKEEGVAEQQQEEVQTDPYAEAPEFWSAERKALWEKIADPEARKAIHEQDAESKRETSKKIEATALERKSFAEKAAQLEGERDQLTNWWKETGPRLATAFQSKWQAVDWNKLAAENPAEYVVQKQQFENDQGLIRSAAERHQQELGQASKRAEKAQQENRRSEHEKLAKALPDAFGKADVAQKTYDEIRDYLIDQGVPADRIPNVYEAHTVGVAYKAMLYDKAQKAALKPSTTATPTPRRIAPGASAGSQPKSSEAYRQASERLNNGDKLSDGDVALLFA